MKRRRTPRTFRDSRGASWRWRDCTPEREPRLIPPDGEPHYGLCDYDAREVLVNVEQGAETLAATRFHELVHVALHGSSTMPPEEEERIIAVLEMHLLPLLEHYGLDLGWRPR